MGQEDGEKWTAAVDLQPTLPKSNRLLAWLLAQPGVVAIPKAVQEAHQRENLAATQLQLLPDDLATLDRLFPPPVRNTPLAML